MRIEIMFGMMYYLLNHGKTKAKVLASYFEVSTRSIYRYASSMSSFVPIITILGPFGGIDIDKSAKIGKSFFSVIEKQMILNALDKYNFNLGYRLLIDKIKAL